MMTSRCQVRSQGNRVVALVGMLVFLGATMSAHAATKLDWWMWPAGPQVLPKFEQIAAEFNKTHATVKVKLNQTPGGGYMDKMQAMIIAGKPADMMQLDHANFFFFQGKGLVQDITAQYRRDIDDADMFQSVMGSTSVEGKRYGITPFFHTIANYYNVKLFSEAGLPSPEALSQSKQWDWDTFLLAMTKLTKRDGNGKLTQAGLQSGWGLNDAFVWAAGGTYTDEKQAQFLMDSPQVVEGLQFVQDLAYKHRVMGLSFTSGKAGMYVGGTWERLQLATGARNVVWDIVPFPVHPTVRKEITWLDRAVYVLPRGAKRKAEAFDLIKFCLSKQVQEIYASTFDVVPVRKSVAFSDIFLKSGSSFGRTVNNGALLRGIENGHFSPAGFRWQRAWDTFMAPRMAKVAAGQMSPKEAVTGVRAAFEKALNRK